MGYIKLIGSNREFGKLWVAQLVSLFGDWFSTITISALIASYTAGTEYQGIAVSSFFIARLLPPVVMRPLAGVIADRFDRKRLLILSDIARALAVLGLLFATQGPEYLPLVYVFVVAQFLFSAIFEPARSAIVPSLLYRHELVIGNTLSNMTWSAMLAVGAIAGGVAAELLGTQAVLLIDAMTFVVSALLIVSIVIPETPRSETDQETRKVKSKSQRTIRDALRYLASHPAAAAGLFVKTGMGITIFDTVMIIYGTQIFVLGDKGITSVGIFWAAFGAGAIIGPLIANLFSDDTVHKLRQLIIVGYALIALGWFFWGLAPSLELVAMAIFIRAMGGAVCWTYSSVIIQLEVPDEYLGRAFSFDLAGFELVQTIGMVAIGVLIDIVGNEGIQAVVYGSALAAAAPLLIWIWIVRRLEKFKPLG